MQTRTAVALLCALLLASCGRPYRVSRGAVNQLMKKHESFVLVFGSLSMQHDSNTPPTIRFVHQANRMAPQYLLYSLTISSGDRFYAILKAPPELKRLDEFEAEVGESGAPFDRITYVRLPADSEPHALYVGEVRVTPAQNRTAQGQMLAVNIRDDFQTASQELHRFYPRFAGSVSKVPLLRAPVPMPAPPARVK